MKSSVQSTRVSWRESYLLPFIPRRNALSYGQFQPYIIASKPPCFEFVTLDSKAAYSRRGSYGLGVINDPAGNSSPHRGIL